MIKNKTIVITGSEGLIGKDIVKYFKKKKIMKLLVLILLEEKIL